MHKEVSLRGALSTVGFRLMSLGIVGLDTAEALRLLRGTVPGWSYYLTGPELTFEFGSRVIVGLIGTVLGTAAAIPIASFFWYFKPAGERLSEWTVRLRVLLVLFFEVPKPS